MSERSLLRLTPGQSRLQGGCDWRNFFFVAALCAVAVFLSGTALASELTDVARKVNLFGLQLYGKVAAKSNNVAVSPLSVSQALIMLAGGAQGETRKEILFTLGMNEQSAQLLASLRQKLSEGTGDESGFRLAFADAVWLGEGLTPTPAYQSFLQTYFGATVQNVPLAKEPDSARQLINLWTQQNTGNLIEELLPAGSLNAQTRLVLTDAVYFNARWKHAFDASLSAPGEFKGRAAGGAPAAANAKPAAVTVKMMHTTLAGRVENGRDYQALSIPYLGGRYSLIVILPKPGADIEVAEKALPDHEGWFQQGWEQEVELTLPRFRLGTTASLRDALLMMGIADAFSSEKANFKTLCPEKLVLDDLLHGAQIEVQEEGTRAAAVTALIPEATSPSNKPKTVPFVVDRPFVYLIRHEPTKLALFVGRTCTLPDEKPADKNAKAIRASDTGYGPWKFGMTMEQVMAIAECGPYRPDEDGGLKCIHAPWQEFNDKHAVFSFDGSGQLAQIKLWLNATGVREEKARESLQSVEKFLEPFAKGKEKGLAESLFKRIAADAQPDRSATQGEDLSAAPGQPRTRVTLIKHPQLGWYVTLTFNPL